MPSGEAKSLVNTIVTVRDHHYAVVKEGIKEAKDHWKLMKLDREAEEKKLVTANNVLFDGLLAEAVSFLPGVFSNIISISLDLLPVVQCTIPLAQPMMVLMSQAPHVVPPSSTELTAPPAGSVGRGNDDDDNREDGESVLDVDEDVFQPPSGSGCGILAE